MTGTAVVRSPAPAATAVDVLNRHPSPITQAIVENQPLIEPLLPEGVRFLTVVWDVVSALAKDATTGGALAKCTPDSVLLAVVQVQAWGLEIGRTAHLVPFGRACTPLRDYKGEIQMATDARVIRHATAHCVYDGEEFQYEQGLNPILRHVPSVVAKERGAMLGCYALLTLPTGERVAHYMPLADIDKIRTDHSKQWKSGACPPWYAKKTAIRQALKTLPKSTRVTALIERLERADGVHVPRATEITAAMADVGGERVDTATGEIVGDAVVSDGTEPAAPLMTAEQAKRYPFPYRRGTPMHGRPLAEIDSETLTRIAGWIVEQQESRNDPYFHNEHLLAINLVCADRENAQAEPEPAQHDEPPVGELPLEGEPERPAPGSNRHDVPKPGKVSDALEMPLGDEPRRRSRNAQEI